MVSVECHLPTMKSVLEAWRGRVIPAEEILGRLSERCDSQATLLRRFRHLQDTDSIGRLMVCADQVVICFTADGDGPELSRGRRRARAITWFRGRGLTAEVIWHTIPTWDTPTTGCFPRHLHPAVRRVLRRALDIYAVAEEENPGRPPAALTGPLSEPTQEAWSLEQRRLARRARTRLFTLAASPTAHL
jgi:hypothetical protein